MTERKHLGNVSKTLEALLTACLDAQANGIPLPEAVDAATLTAEQMMTDADAEAARGIYTRPRHGWTCFHCGETFTTPGSARDHFGMDQSKDPACRIKVGEERGLVMALREAEAELKRYRAEDSDKDRQMAAMASDHGAALRDEEEKGYAKGLRDGRMIPPDAEAPVPELADKKPLVLYFHDDVGRDEFIALFKEAKPNARTIKL